MEELSNFLLSKFGGCKERRNQKERLQHESCQHQQMQEDDKVTPTSQVPQRPTTGTWRHLEQLLLNPVS